MSGGGTTITNPGTLPKPRDVLHLFLSPEQLQKARAPPAAEQQPPGPEDEAAAAMKKLEEANATGLLDHMGMIARVIKDGVNGLDTVFYRDDTGIMSNVALAQLRQVMIAKGRQGMAPSSDDCADVLERYADRLPVQILENAMDDLPMGHKIGIAAGKAAAETFVLSKEKTRKELMEDTEEMAVSAVYTMCLTKEHWQEMVPVYELMIRHPRLIRWICRFIRYYFHVERPEDIEYINMYEGR